MVFASVPTISKPWMTSTLVSRNVTGLPTGTCSSSGRNENVIATTVAVAPVAVSVTPW